MRFVLLLLTLVPFLYSCNNPEEIKPVKPVQDSTVQSATIEKVLADEQAPAAKSDSIPHLDSAFYRAEKFQNMPYRILLPKNYDPEKKYPLLVFLHGISERGADNEAQLKWGSSQFLKDSIRDAYPAFVVFPQCDLDHRWLDPTATDALKELIDNLRKQLNIDHNKINIAGLSMGAYGTYAMVAKFPGLFNSAVAISGDGDSAKADEMAKTNWRIYAGKKDLVVTYDKSEKMANVLKESGAEVSLKIYPDADHVNSWIDAFAEKDFCSWLLK